MKEAREQLDLVMTIESALAHNFLIIDDDNVNAFICRKVIQKAYPDAEIRAFNDPKSGLAYLSGRYPPKEKKTVVFLDIDMPGMTGWELLDHFEHLPCDVREQYKIYVLSASVSNHDLSKAEQHPLVASYITKPLSVQHLQELAHAS